MTTAKSDHDDKDYDLFALHLDLHHQSLFRIIAS